MNTIDSLIEAVEQTRTPTELIHAAQTLADSHSALAVPSLIAILGYENLAAASIATCGLVSIGRSAVEPLMAAVDRCDYDAKTYIVRALAAIGDPRSLDILLECAETDCTPSVRRAAIKGLGNVRWHWLTQDLEQDLHWSREAIGTAQDRVLRTLRFLLDDRDWSMRYAAVVALDAIAASNSGINVFNILKVAQARESDLSVQARIRTALQKQLVTA
ncbi:HEAT repeat domain-containing protein [Tumidithrix elongata RA019]|uniref:HEAT repeat domain-containing protein n=1 Tax=Tumidithrix elongata BACA0141 TaxID=2716417 RepID=A0AAW9Q716_9CYAN|nr:HEAT repeat domain-containing protein [Tumidithrix elongata RA019]